MHVMHLLCCLHLLDGKEVDSAKTIQQKLLEGFRNSRRAKLGKNPENLMPESSGLRCLLGRSG